jgi:hypothetical protein
MNNIPTAEEVYFKHTQCIINHGDIKIAMIEFAKLHCEAQLKAILENVKMGTKRVLWDDPKENEDAYMNVSIIDKDSIINAYDFNNIK